MSRPVISMPKPVECKDIITDIDLLDETVAEDVAFLRDPNDVAMLLCYGMRVNRVQVARVIFGNRKPQRVVLFGFNRRKYTYKKVLKMKLSFGESLKNPNINIAQFRLYLDVVKTLIHGCIG